MVTYKTLVVKRFGWRRICRNTQRFGWVLTDAEQHTETTTTTSYEGRVVGDRVYIDEHKTTSTKVSIHMSFYRDDDDYANLPAILPIEFFYKIAFFFRRIIGAILPFFTVLFVIFLLMGDDGSGMTGAWIGAMVAWIVLMIVENVLALWAYKVLRLR